MDDDEVFADADPDEEWRERRMAQRQRWLAKIDERDKLIALMQRLADGSPTLEEMQAKYPNSGYFPEPPV